MAVATQPKWLNTVLQLQDTQHFEASQEHEKAWEVIIVPW